jgi:hypothetical protein
VHGVLRVLQEVGARRAAKLVCALCCHAEGSRLGSRKVSP